MSNPTEKVQPKIENSEETSPNLKDYFSTGTYSRIEKGGLDYIQKKKWYLIISAVFPIYIFIVEILTTLFYLRSLKMEVEFHGRVISYILTSSFGTMFILILLLFQFLFLLGWRKKLQQYLEQKEGNHSRDADPNITDGDLNQTTEQRVSLTKLFYGIVNHMEKIRTLFFFLNFLALYMIFSSTRIFWLNKRPFQMDNLQFGMMKWLKITSSILLLFYLGFEWFHFLKWNQKFSQLRAFEKRVYEELDL
ncbi:hypothetical protein NEF87_003081 [Candidatus Lokiarchaeum ossiferum]|uniref:DUF4234 domain-containing protein n=1 Tax=Candidatus Lokiarchaeum ossiferum TaxID=2951803 RepID=A0ABY6HTF3_9ARCH|nr:hypothetical protein NEF87_003081 [Candidatus Lokiarchaeum sp. B-35]